MAKEFKNKISAAINSVTIRGDDDIELDINSSAPYDTPRSNSKLSIRRNQSSTNYPKVIMLSGCELKLLQFLSVCIDKKSKCTPPVSIAQLMDKFDYPGDTIKKSLKRLVKKGFIGRQSFKSGRGGWTVYAIVEQVLKQLETN